MVHLAMQKQLSPQVTSPPLVVLSIVHPSSHKTTFALSPLAMAWQVARMTRILTSPDGTPASPFAFGTMQFGGRADAAQSAEIYAACRAAGLTHFDTAWVYTDGSSEEILGGLIKGERDQLIIASKVGYTGGAGPDNMQAQFDTSRARLGLDCIDILYLHRFDPDTDLRVTLEWFATRKQVGDIRYIGLSNFAAWQVMKAQMLGRDLGVQTDILQPMYSLVKRQAEVEILPMCADQGIAIAPYSPLGGGLLTGKYISGGEGRLSEDARYNSRYGPTWMHDAARGLSALAQERGVSPATLAVAWAAAHPSAPMPIISGRTAEQIAPSLAALEFQMDAALYDAIAALSPRPAPATDRLEEQELGA
jgi:aryl-alcohol dehydrogenase-like predicted oxidoreductase